MLRMNAMASRNNQTISPVRFLILLFYPLTAVFDDVFSACDCLIHRGYSNFLLNMAFISPSEVENIYIS